MNLLEYIRSIVKEAKKNNNKYPVTTGMASRIFNSTNYRKQLSAYSKYASPVNKFEEDFSIDCESLAKVLSILSDREYRYKVFEVEKCVDELLYFDAPPCITIACYVDNRNKYFDTDNGSKIQIKLKDNEGLDSIFEHKGAFSSATTFVMLRCKNKSEIQGLEKINFMRIFTRDGEKFIAQHYKTNNGMVIKFDEKFKDEIIDKISRVLKKIEYSELLECPWKANEHTEEIPLGV